MYNRAYTPEKITRLEENEIFVFGSNLLGSHGGGAARLAYERFGAEWGNGVGLQGNSYAIPTMQGGVDTIRPYVDEFIRFAGEHPHLTFLVTRIGCGIAGFRDEEIAPLFQAAADVENIFLPEQFVAEMECSGAETGAKADFSANPAPVPVSDTKVDAKVKSDEEITFNDIVSGNNETVRYG